MNLMAPYARSCRLYPFYFTAKWYPLCSVQVSNKISRCMKTKSSIFLWEWCHHTFLILNFALICLCELKNRNTLYRFPSSISVIGFYFFLVVSNVNTSVKMFPSFNETGSRFYWQFSAQLRYNQLPTVYDK